MLSHVFIILVIMNTLLLCKHSIIVVIVNNLGNVISIAIKGYTVYHFVHCVHVWYPSYYCLLLLGISYFYSSYSIVLLLMVRYRLVCIA